MLCLSYVSRSLWLQKVTDTSQKCPHTFRAGCWTFVLKLFSPSLNEQITSLREKQLSVYIHLLFDFVCKLWPFQNGENCLLKLMLTAFNLLHTELIDRLQVEMHPGPYQTKFLIGCLRVKGFATGYVHLISSYSVWSAVWIRDLLREFRAPEMDFSASHNAFKRWHDFMLLK